MAGLNLEPFPRQVLIGNPGALGIYSSETYDLKDYKTLAYTMTTYASLPNTLSPPALAILYVSNDLQGPWENLTPGGIGGAVGSTVNGMETLSGQYLRVEVNVQADETTSFDLRLVARME